MVGNEENPLITVVMLEYNQEAYIHEAVRSVLAQTYEPLEIIISDDCSSDSTWSIIQKEVKCYQSGNNKNVRIVLNRNKKNLGIIQNFEAIIPSIHGALFVGAAGDDISLPNRVEQIVREWKNTGGTSTVIIHDGIRINLQGREIGTVGERSIICPLGACMAYSSRVLREFERVTYKECFDDHVLGRRGALIGEVLILKDKLVRYRVGAGISSVLYSRRGPEIRAANGRMFSYRQSLLDIESWYKRGKLSEAKYLELKKEYEDSEKENELFIKLASDTHFMVRWNAYFDLYVKRRLWLPVFLRWPYLLPKRIGDWTYWCYDRLRKMA